MAAMVHDLVVVTSMHLDNELGCKPDQDSFRVLSAACWSGRIDDPLVVSGLVDAEDHSVARW